MRRRLLLLLHFRRIAVHIEHLVAFQRRFVERNLILLAYLDHAQLAGGLAELNNRARIDDGNICQVLLPRLVLRYNRVFTSNFLAKK